MTRPLAQFRIVKQHGRELLLAVTMLSGFVLAEVPANIKNYTETDARYSVENYGGATQLARLDDRRCENC